MRHLTTLGVTALAVFVLGLGAYAQDLTIDIGGDVLNPRQWTPSDLKQRFAKEIQTVKFSTGIDQAQHTGTGILLVSLLQAAGPKVEKTPKHYDLSFFVLLEGRDKYRVYFSLAELLQACGHAQAWLLLDMDGKPLAENEAPARLAVLSDQGHDRYLYAIARITLVDGTKIADQRSAGR